jgi:hypothetical protein
MAITTKSSTNVKPRSLPDGGIIALPSQTS